MFFGCWFANDKVLIKECAIGVGNQYYLIKENEANGEHYNPFGTEMSCLIENFEDMMDKEVGAVHIFSGFAPTPLTEEQAQMMKDYIYSCNSISVQLDEDLWKIIQNEVQTYFEGGQASKQAAEMIQNRASILIIEKY